MRPSTSHATFFFVSLLLAATLGAGCEKKNIASSTQKSAPVTPTCTQNLIYDFRTRSCVQPTSLEEAQELTGRFQLETLQNQGDAVAYVLIHFKQPVDRHEFEAILERTAPVAVVDIHFTFPDIAGGMSITSRTNGLAPSSTILLASSVDAVRTKYMNETGEQERVSRIVGSFVQKQERYVQIDLRATPSKLLSAWNQDSSISWIEVPSSTTVR